MEFAPLYPLLYRVLPPLFPQCCWSGNRNSPAIALTFDDGPHPQYTPQLLEVLDEFDIKASFFWLGVCVERFPQIAKAVSDRKHHIGLHGWDHRCFPLLSPTELKQSLETTQTTISQVCHLDLQPAQYVRPPNGVFTPQTLKLLSQWHYKTVMWSVVPEDWVNPGVTVVINRVQKQVHNGAIIVLHDGACGGQDVAQTTRLLIPLLLRAGYHFVTVESLWQQREIVK